MAHVLYVLLALNILNHMDCLGFTCSHDEHNGQAEIYRSLIHGSRNKRSSNGLLNNLNIYTHYDSSVGGLGQEGHILKNIVEQAVKFWENSLQVKGPSGTLRLQRTCARGKPIHRTGFDFSVCNGPCAESSQCNKITIPDQHLQPCYQLNGSNIVTSSDSGDGVTADFILYVSAWNGGRCEIGNTVSYALFCRQEPDMDRPVAGSINFCPNNLAIAEKDLSHLLDIAKHELLHTLGFSRALFAFYRDENGNPLTPRDSLTGLPENYDSDAGLYIASEKVVKAFTRTNWNVRGGVINKTLNYIVTKKVKEEAQKHFQCSLLEGAEIEDYMSEGTALSHLEKRIYEDELMSGGYTLSPSLSRITLALLEDTGWYVANYSQASDNFWGKNLGCNFARKSCKYWIEQQNQGGLEISPYCNKLRSNSELDTKCSHDGSAVISCNLIKYDNPIPGQYQNFDNFTGSGITQADLQYLGGSQALADYCPYYEKFSWTPLHSEKRTSLCKLPDHISPKGNYLLEVHGLESICLEHTNKWQLSQCHGSMSSYYWGSGCYHVTCSKQTGLSILLASGQQFYCHHDNQILDVSITTKNWLHQGTIICPNCTEVCGFPCQNGYTQSEQNMISSEIPCPSDSNILSLCMSNYMCIVMIILIILCVIAVGVLIVCFIKRRMRNSQGNNTEYLEMISNNKRSQSVQDEDLKLMGL